MLKGKTAVITGGTRGIGFAIAKKYLDNGANVAICGSRQDSVEKALARLTDYEGRVMGLWPDLCDPKQVAEAFDKLEQSGKVRHFGVSNHSPYQIELLKKCVKQPLVVNQLQFSIMHAGMVSTGMNVNIHSDFAIDRDGGVLDYCRLHDITIQPWSPFQYGMFEGVFLNNPKFPQVNAKIDEIAEKHGVSNTAIAAAWILRHPAHMQHAWRCGTAELVARAPQSCAVRAKPSISREILRRCTRRRAPGRRRRALRPVPGQARAPARRR